MRTVGLVALLASVSATLACSAGAPGLSGERADAPSAGQDGTPASTGTLAPVSGPTVVAALVPSGVQCVVASVTGADTETVTASVAVGASSVALSFGSLTPGAITVTANAYNTACPGTGAPTWLAEPVQATIVEGLPTLLSLTLHPAASAATGTATFSLPAISIATGPRTSYAVLSDGSVRAWGANEAGEFGSGTTSSGSVTPVTVPVPPASQIVAGNGFACVTRLADSGVTCWGFNGGEIPGITMGAIQPPVSNPGLFATQISALGGNLAFIGIGSTAVVGDVGSTYGCSTGCSVAGIQWGLNSGYPAISVAVGTTSLGLVNACWVTEEGTPVCNWTGTSFVAPASSRVFMGVDYSAAIPSFACSILVNGNVACWGANGSGELGIGSTSAQTQPVTVPNLHNVTALALSRGVSASFTGTSTCAVSGGSVFCAGNNAYGQLGNQSGALSLTFVPVVGLTVPVVSIASGTAHTCALDSEGAVHCWGDNDDGELGDGTTITRYAPVSVVPW